MLTGPGTHSIPLTAALQNANRLLAVIQYYPDWRMVYADGSCYEKPLYRQATRVMWGIWRRIPYLGQSEYPRLWHYRLYDWLAAQNLPEETQFLWAWSGMSLYTMQKARQKKIPIFLEFPTAHPNFWNRISTHLYKKLHLSGGKFSIIPKSVASRKNKELALADVVIVLSSFARETMLKEGIPMEKIQVIPLGVDENTFSPAKSLSQHPFRVLYVGRIDPLKGVHHLLAAWKELRLPHAELWIVGHVVPEMRSLLAKYEGGFRYFGLLPREALPQIYRQASLFVFPTLLDSFGMVLLEAMACGLPVIATTHSAAPDLLTEGVIHADDPEALKRILLEFYERKDIKDVGALNRQTILRNYTEKHYYMRIAHLLQSYGL